MNRWNFTIVTFKLTNDFSIATVCNTTDENRAVDYARTHIEQLKSMGANVHPCLQYVDKNTHTTHETWSVDRFRHYYVGV